MGTPALAVLARALDPEVGTPDDATSERILDAALALSAASGLRHLTMDDVARRAGVGRMTVYRRFSDRDGLVDALVEREIVLAFLNSGPGGVFGAAVAFLSHRLRESQDAGVLPAELDVDVAAELLVRLALSFVLVPRSGLPLDDDERLRAIARAHLAPLLTPGP
jgi:AcrR family transcriptional regulator